MLIIDLEKITEEGQSIDREISLAALDRQTNDFRIPESIALSGRVMPMEGHVFRLTGEMAVELEVDCVRCLEPVAIPIGEKLELMYVPSSRNVGLEEDEDRQLDDDEMAISYYQDNQLDLGHLVWEQIYLALPMKPLCTDACEGLCPRCGVNRNDQRCDCDTQDLDPRMAQLKSLLESGKHS